MLDIKFWADHMLKMNLFPQNARFIKFAFSEIDHLIFFIFCFSMSVDYEEDYWFSVGIFLLKI